MGATDVGELRDIGRVLASLKEPEPPEGFKDAGRLLQLAKAVWDMKPATVGGAPCQEVVLDAAMRSTWAACRSRPAGRATSGR